MPFFRNIGKFRLPLLISVGMVAILLFVHLIWVYIYLGGSTIGIPWGSINIGLIGKAPDIPNPLEYGKERKHDLILTFLFRSLILYNYELAKYEGDIAQCDISDLSKISCTLTWSRKWSDSTPIKVADIEETMHAFKENPPNEKMKNFLKKVSIVAKDEKTILFESEEKNSLMLDLLTYPILRSDIIDRIRTGRLGPDGYVTSGPYTYGGREKNEQYGYEKITIVKNGKEKSNSWLEKYNFVFFPDEGALERAKDILNILVPSEKPEKLTTLPPRFEEYTYANQEYLGMFLNTDRIKSAIRKHILLNAQSGLSGAILSNERPAFGLFPFSGGIKIEKNFADLMKEVGYMKVNERLGVLDADTGGVITTISTGSITIPNNTFIHTPTKKSIYFSEVADGTITISGNVPIGVKNVFIGDYALQEFVPGNDSFVYKVSLENGTLQEGKNTYPLIFESANGTKTVRDTLTIYYERDHEKLQMHEKSLETEALAKLNTPELVSERKKKREDERTLLKWLDQRYYYDATHNPFTITLLYLSEPASLEQYATIIGSKLESLGIRVDMKPINTKDFSLSIQKWEKNYDILLVGFEATGRFSRVGQIFLSTEAKNGINFSKIESKTLDGLFVELRTADTNEKTQTVMQKIGAYMREEAFFLPISSPLHSFYIDRNLKQIKKIETFQDITTLASIIRKASIKEEYLIHIDGKSISWFFRWLFSGAHKL